MFAKFIQSTMGGADEIVRAKVSVKVDAKVDIDTSVRTLKFFFMHVCLILSCSSKPKVFHQNIPFSSSGQQYYCQYWNVRANSTVCFHACVLNTIMFFQTKGIQPKHPVLFPSTAILFLPPKTGGTLNCTTITTTPLTSRRPQNLMAPVAADIPNHILPQS